MAGLRAWKRAMMMRERKRWMMDSLAKAQYPSKETERERQ